MNRRFNGRGDGGKSEIRIPKSEKKSAGFHHEAHNEHEEGEPSPPGSTRLWRVGFGGTPEAGASRRGEFPLFVFFVRFVVKSR
jgi:hypothetical protein